MTHEYTVHQWLQYREEITLSEYSPYREHFSPYRENFEVNLNSNALDVMCTHWHSISFNFASTAATNRNTCPGHTVPFMHTIVLCNPPSSFPQTD